MLDQHQVDEIIINDEIERLKLLFERNNYNKQEKIWFIDSKKITAIENKDLLLLEVCNILLKGLESE